MNRPLLLAVGHGSRDPRSPATIAELVGTLRARHPRLPAGHAFLELSEPALPDVLRAAVRDGYRAIVVVPLLLGSAYHARQDIPAVVADFHTDHPDVPVHIADVLAPDERLEDLALRRLRAAGITGDEADVGVLLGAAGSSQLHANDAVAQLAGRWQRRFGWAGVRAAFASAEPDVPAAVAELRAAGARRIAVASWFLAPGRLPDAVRDAAVALDPAAVLAEPLGPAPEVADVVADRYSAAAADPPDPANRPAENHSG